MRSEQTSFSLRPAAPPGASPSFSQGSGVPQSRGLSSRPGTSRSPRHNSSVPCVYLKSHSCSARPVWSPPAPLGSLLNLQPRQTLSAGRSQGEPKSAPMEPAAEATPAAHLSSKFRPTLLVKPNPPWPAFQRRGGGATAVLPGRGQRRGRGRAEHGAADRGAHLPA